MNCSYTLSLIILSVFLSGAVAIAQLDGVAGTNDYEIVWHTIDGGGGTSTGNGYELAGTIGQPDAGVLSGGGYSLTGGYWAGAASGDVPVPTCTGDITNSIGGGPDGTVDGFDLLALLGNWGPCPSPCAADLTNSIGGGPDGTVDGFDLLALLGNWGPCP